MTTPAERNLTAEEVDRILTRATEMPAEEEPEVPAADRDEGLSVTELQDVAREVGIPLGALDRAIEEVSRSAPDSGTAHTRYGQHRDTVFVHGRVTGDDLAWVLRLLNQLGHLDGRGQVEYLRGAIHLRWPTSAGMELDVVTRPSETIVTVQADELRTMAGSAPLFMGVGVILSLLLAGVFDVAPGAMLGTTLAGAAGGGAWWLAYWKYRMDRVKDAAHKAATGVAEVFRMVIGRSNPS